MSGEQFDKLVAGKAADDSIADKVLREVELAGTGLIGGIKQGIKETVDDPWGGGLRLAGSVGIGLAIGALRSKNGWLRMTGEVGGIALGTAFVADIVASKRSSMFTKAVSDTWDSAAGFERNKTIAKETLGRFAFDAAAMTALGVGTAKVTERLMPKSVSVSEMLKNLTQKEGIKWQDGRPVPTTLANHFQSFPTKAKGYIETGKDAVVIELVDNTVLKILKTPLSPGSGTREFDLPILKHGTVAGGRFEYITQPKVPIVQDKAVANEFAQQVRLKGFNFWDREPSQLGIYKGKVKLVDYDAVAKMSVDPYA